MKKFLLKSLALLLTLTFLISAASLAISVSALTYVNGGNSVHSTYKNNRYYTNVTSIPLSNNNRADLLAVALSQVQYQESASQNSLSGLSGGSGNYTEYTWNYGNGLGTYSYAWCACFVTWCLRQAGINTVATGLSNAARNHLGDAKYLWNEVSCGYWVSQIKTLGYWKGSAGRYGGTYVPKSGDLIFFENGGDTWSDHIGIVVYTSGSTVYTIEGNTSSGTGLEANGGGVYYKSYSLSSTKILGYGAMPYNSTSSPIDYSGNTPTTGLYIATTNTYKYLRQNADSTSAIIANIPGGVVFSVDAVVGKGVGTSYLKVTYNGVTGYVANNSDRVIQLTQTTPSGGDTGTDTPVVDGTGAMAAVIGALGFDGGALTGVSNMTANSSKVNAHKYNGTATTIDWQGYAMIDGGQTDSFVFSVDEGVTWNAATVSVMADADSSIDATVQQLSGATWTKLGTTDAYKNAHFIVRTDLSASKGKTVNVILGRLAASGATYRIAAIEGVSIPGSSSSGNTTPSTLYYTANVDEINGSAPSTTVRGTQASQPSYSFGGSATSINVRGWCAMLGGQGGIYYSVDGGSTWKYAGDGYISSPETTAILNLAKSTAGGSSYDWGTDSDYRFNVTVDLSAYAGTTVSLAFSRVASFDSAKHKMFTITNITVPSSGGSNSGSGSGSGTLSGTPVITGSPSTAMGYAATVKAINGLGSDGKALASNESNSWDLLGYRISTSPYTPVPAVIDASANGITVNSDNTISIDGWALVNAGQNGYIYSIDGTNWYSCTGTLGTSSDDITNEKATATSKAALNSFNAAKCKFNGLTADLTGCEGSTVNLMFAVIPSFTGYTDRACHFLTISNLTVPETIVNDPSGGAVTGNITTGTTAAGTVTNTAIPSYTAPTVWTIDQTTGALTYGSQTYAPSSYMNSEVLARGNQGGITDTGVYAQFPASAAHQQYLMPNMQRYLVMKYNAPSGTFPTAVLTYYDNTLDDADALITPSWTTDGQWHTLVADMLGPISHSAGTSCGGNGQTFAIIADNYGTHSVAIEYIATFTSLEAANQWLGFRNQIAAYANECKHNVGTTDLITAKAATCGATGYTAGKVCSACLTVIETPQTVAATTSHTWSSNTCTGGTRTCSGCGAKQPGTLSHSWSTNTCIGELRTCSTCSSTQAGTLAHSDGNSDRKCDSCSYVMSSSSSGSSSSGSNVTTTPVPTVHSCVWKTDNTGKIYCSSGCNKYSPTPTTYNDATSLSSYYSGGVQHSLAVTNDENLNLSYVTYPAGAKMAQFQYLSSTMQSYIIIHGKASTATTIRPIYYQYADAEAYPDHVRLIGVGTSWSATQIAMASNMTTDTTQIWGIAPDWNGSGASLTVERVVTFASQSEAASYATYLGYLTCSHPNTSAATTAQAATCTATGYTSGTKCSTCGVITEQPTATSSLAHADNNSDGACDTCGTSTGGSSSGGTSSGGTSSGSTVSISKLVSVVDLVNGVGSDGTTNSNYSNILISTGTTLASTPATSVVLNADYISVSGWCLIDGGQNNVIKYSIDGGNVWLGTCTNTTFSDGSADANLVEVAKNFVGMSSPSNTGAVFSNATVSKSALGTSSTVTFGRQGADGVVYPFATITGLSSECSHANKSGSTVNCTTDIVCYDCGAIVTPALGHSYTNVDAVAATCTTAGNTAGQTCSRCNHSTVIAIAAKGHVYNVVMPAKAATCTQTGLTEGLQCECGDIKTPQTVVPVIAHNYTYLWSTTQHWQECQKCETTTAAADHTYGTNGVCTTCSYGCSHSGGSAATCTTAQTCTKCGTEITPALGHNYETAYSSNETHHWHKCLRSGCSSTSDYAEHSFEGNKCVCGVKKNSYPDFHSSIDWINGVGPDNDSTTPYTDRGGNTNKGTDSISVPFTNSINYLRIQGWALAVGGIKGYMWSVDGEVWNYCTYDSLSDATSAHIDAASQSGITSANSTVANSIFVGLCADISAYAGQTLDVTFAAVGTDGSIIPMTTITGVKAGTPAKVNASFDEFRINGTAQGFNGFTSGSVGGVSVFGADSTTGALSISNIVAGQSIALWGWIGYQAEVESFGYYFNNYTSQVHYVANYPTDAGELSVIQGLAGEHARRMLINVDTNTLVGNCTITFVAKFKDGSIAPITTWNATVSNPSTSNTGTISNQYANVIIISGQSNAYGASPTIQSDYHITNMYGSETFPNIKIHYTNINGGAGPNDPMRVITGNTGFDTYRVGIGAQSAEYMGPEFGLAQYLKENYTNGEQFYIIKFTAAGTFLDGDWLPGDMYYDAVLSQFGYASGVESRPHASPNLGSYLYDHMLYDIQTSLNNIQASTSLPIKIHSFMWVQGESDAGHPNMAADYQAREAQLVSGIRNTFSAYAAEGGISFVNYSIARDTHKTNDTSGNNQYLAGDLIWPYSEALNASKQANAQYMFDVATMTLSAPKSSYNLGKSVLLNKTDWISKEWAGFDTDYAHLSAQSMHLLGRAFGAAMAAMDGKSIAHVHTTTTVPAVDATCTTSGLTEGLVCSDCGAVLAAQTIVPATGHTYDDENDMNCNTCNELRPSENCAHSFTEGDYVNTNAEYHYNTCTLCGVELNRESHVYSASCDADCNTCGYIRVVSHNPITVAATPATCIAAGVGESEICQSCGKITKAGATIPKLSHSFTGVTVVEPTCTTRGYTAHMCVNGCNVSYNTNYVNATSHSYTSFVTNATCTEVGYTTYICEKCGDFYASDYVNATGHRYSTSAIAPSCTENGYTLHSCDNCSSSYVTNYIAATGHTYSATTVAGTCMTRGYILYACSCGAQYKADFTEIIGHNFTVSNTVASTCFAIGYTIYACDRDGCDAEYRNNFTPATGHNYEVAESNGTTTKYVCTGGCGLFYVTVPEGMGHTHAYELTVVASTCTTDGYTKYTCSCGDEYISDETAAMGHNYIANVVPATCTANGYTTYTCSRCSDSYKADETVATGHRYSETVVAPSCGVDGYTLYTCSCGHSYQGNFVTNSGHDLVVTNRVYPTLTTQGYTTYQCSSCGETEIGNILNYTDLVSSAYTGTTTPVARGIDVSYWQNGGYSDSSKCTPFPFAAAKAAGIDFVIIRAGTTNMKDPAFEMNYADAKAAGLDVGVYYYTYSTTVAGAQNDANRLLGWLEGKQFEYPIYFDLEDECQQSLGATMLKNMTNAFFEIMQSNGYYTALYIYENFLKNYLDTDYTISTYDIWYARYLYAHENYQWSVGSTLPTWSFTSQYPSAFGIWQFGSTSHLPAYGNGTSNIDANIAYKDYPTIMKTYGFNGYTAEGDVGSNTAKQYVWITASSLNVRTSPDFSSTTNKIGLAYNGEKYEVIEKTSTYIKILFNGQQAYISANTSYVTFTDPNA